MDPQRTALLVMDIQLGIVERIGDPALLERIGSAAAAARRAGVRVIYVKIGFRAGYPELSPRSPMFARLTQSGSFLEGPASEIHQAVAPQPGEVTVTKRRVSAFAGSDLDVVLRAGEIDALVLTGVATSGVVLSTLREASDLDFTLTVLADGCADPDEEVHRVLTEKVFPRQAQVVTVADWVASLGSA
jgi:nicotinamidase-related amidase